MRGVLPLFEKRRIGRAPAWFSAAGGVLAADGDAAAALLEEAATLRRNSGAAYIELRDQRVRWTDLTTSTEHCTHVLALQADAEAQWRAFDAKLRNQIRKAERAGFTAHWGTAQLSGFYRVMLENMRDLGTPIRGEAWFRELLEALGDRAAVLVIAPRGEPIGGMFLAAHRGWFMDISSRRHFADCPNQWLYWRRWWRRAAPGLTGATSSASTRHWYLSLLEQRGAGGAALLSVSGSPGRGGAERPSAAPRPRRPLWKRLSLLARQRRRADPAPISGPTWRPTWWTAPNGDGGVPAGAARRALARVPCSTRNIGVSPRAGDARMRLLTPLRRRPSAGLAGAGAAHEPGPIPRDRFVAELAARRRAGVRAVVPATPPTCRTATAA